MNTPAPHPVERLPEQWRAAMEALGERPFRGDQVFQWVHKHGVLDPARMSNLPKTLRATLASGGLSAPVRIHRTHLAADGTRKMAIALADGAQVETVLLPMLAGNRDDANAAAADLEGEPDDAGQTRVTQCISTQVGCAMACVFCASGIAGLKRHLSAAEIVGQVLLGRAALKSNERLGNIVYMGMGEPLHNYAATAHSIRLLTHSEGLGLSPRRLTISTSGLVPEIQQLGRDFEGRVGLAISLHNADDDKRSALMPINRKYPLRRLMRVLKEYPLRRGRYITIEYTLVGGQNDSREDAKRLALLLADLRVKINLIPMNPIGGSELGPSAPEVVDAFQQVLRRAGFHCFVRRRRGDDVAAACGQLVLPGAKPTAAFVKNQPGDG